MTPDSSFIYFLGEVYGGYIKIGWTAGGQAGIRNCRNRAERDFHSQYELLAAVPGTRDQERQVHKYFEKYLAKEFPRKKEIFYAEPELVEYVNWLRSQWFITLELEDVREDQIGWEFWLPTPERRIPPPVDDPTRLIQVNRSLQGPLAATDWAWMVAPDEIGEDYYTPLEIVEAAREAMGGIDLDPASHPVANRVLKIDDYYHRGRSAFLNPWFGRIWLNPPHGEYGPWFDQIERYYQKGEIEELCMIAPAWAFTTRQAQPLMRTLVRATIVLSPTPKFWGSPSGKEGTNHPHFIIYIGEEVDGFLSAFELFGIPVEIRQKIGVEA